MYRIFLVEDEIVIREGMREFIDWGAYGFSFIGAAPDGELAWSAIQREVPDIVITDIKMPFMDGLELSKLIRKQFPKITIIILSGYDEFTYAREAVNIGVSRYLLKPITKERLVEVLTEVKEQKDEQQRQQAYQQRFETEVESYLTTSRRYFFDALVSGKNSVTGILEHAQKIGISLRADCYNIVLCLLQETDTPGDGDQVAQVQQRIAACFDAREEYELFSAGMDVTAILIKGTPETVDALTDDCMQALVSMREDKRPQIIFIATSGNPVSRISAIATCYKDASKKLFYQADMVHESAAAPAQQIDFNPNEMRASSLGPELIHEFLSTAQVDEIEQFVCSYFDSFGEEASKSVLFRHYIVLNLQFAINAFREKTQLSTAQGTDFEQQKSDLNDALQSLDNSKKYICSLLRETILMRNSVSKNRYQAMLEDVISYMKQHYAEQDISLSAVASIASITPTHFSTIFKQQTGKTFIEYLTQLRMDKARELLRCTSKSSSEIALEVGYKEPHYFSALFKKMNGCSPRAYRNGKGE